jgi:hypothetical protein
LPRRVHDDPSGQLGREVLRVDVDPSCPVHLLDGAADSGNSFIGTVGQAGGLEVMVADGDHRVEVVGVHAARIGLAPYQSVKMIPCIAPRGFESGSANLPFPLRPSRLATRTRFMRAVAVVGTNVDAH